MGSFTSMPKVIPAASESDCDADVSYPREGQREELPEFLARCSRNLSSLPPPIQRKWKNSNSDCDRDNSSDGIIEDNEEHDEVGSESCEKIRVLQWNVLSQGE